MPRPIRTPEENRDWWLRRAEQYEATATKYTNGAAQIWLDRAAEARREAAKHAA